MKQSMTLRIVVTAAGLLLAIVHVNWPRINIDSVAVALLVIAALPWLQPLIKTVEIPGLKVELQELKNKLDEAKGEAADAKGAAESASLKAAFAISASSAPSSITTMKEAAAFDSTDGITALAKEYEDIRETQAPGDARTRAMTDVIRRMIELASSTESFDARSALDRASRGLRLFAYAWFYAKPDKQILVPLVETVCRKEDTPFGQFWGLQAVGHVMDKAGPPPAEVRKMLEEFGARLRPGTDRAYEVKKLLRQFD
jgi:hypothetical protein